jgi:hypothetical protein
MSASLEDPAQPAADTSTRRTRNELIGATVVMVLGIVLTTVGVMLHPLPLAISDATSQAPGSWPIAPGSLLILLGSGWLGNVLARRNVRLFAPGRPRTETGEREP